MMRSLGRRRSPSGLWPHVITVPLLRAMPPNRALELMLTGRRSMPPKPIGSVRRPDRADRLARRHRQQVAAELAGPPAGTAAGARLVYAVWDQEVEASLRLLHPLLTITASTDDAAEGIAAFTEKRPPEWTGRSRR